MYNINLLLTVLVNFCLPDFLNKLKYQEKKTHQTIDRRVLKLSFIFYNLNCVKIAV